MTFLIAGIGASAGGLEAMTELLRGMPKSTGIAFIVVQHLDPNHDSQLPGILATKTAIPVSAALAGEEVQPDRVYVIPPGTALTVDDGRIDLKPRGSGRTYPVDLLFKSLANAYADRAIGIVLSGSDADGSLGIREIKDAGGFTFAQRPESTRFSMMPSHAIDTGCVDMVLQPSEITGELVRLGRRFQANPDSAQEPELKVARVAGAKGEKVHLRHIFRRLRAAYSVDFAQYKQTTIARRIERRMALRRIESLEDYIALIDNEPGELAALYQDFLIRVTEFFRDAESFEALTRYVFPIVCEGRTEQDPIRIWVPGCATGEEVYSVVIAALEYMQTNKLSCGLQVFGTDISETALRVARAGVYQANLIQEMSADRLLRFFTKHEGGYRIAREVRDLCVFAQQDLTRDPPFSKMDLISCRNLLIYLDDTAQRRILRTFHFALRPRGMLFLGPAESVGQSELFEPVDKHSRLFQRTPNTGGGSIALGTRTADSYPLEPASSNALNHADGDSLLREADRLLLARFTPAALLVNQALTILQFRGSTGAYLQPAGGVPSLDLRRVVRPELLVDILPAIEEARTTHASSERQVLMSDGREISMEVVPLVGPTGAPSFLILFDDRAHAAPAGQTSPIVALPESEKDRRLLQLEREVEGLRNYMRAATEEHGAIQEELRSAHEEVLSANEELQSANEELESSKEELQSTNEELLSTIDELRTRNQQLAALNTELAGARHASERARSYADVIIETVRESLVVLNADQRILRVNPAFLETLQIARDHAEGKFLHEVDEGRWNIPALRLKLDELRSLAEPLDDFEVIVDLAGGNRRVLSLSARAIPGNVDRAELYLLAFEDVTARADLAAGLVADSERKDEFLATLGHELRHPLTPISHSTYLLRQRTSDPDSLEMLEAIDSQTKRLTRFVDELLDVARIGRGLIEIRQSRVDLGAVVREAVQGLAPFIEERKLELSLVLPPSPLFVNGDADRLDQVTTNLVENAAKYTDPGGKISVSLERRGDQAVLIVSDTGIGIAAENLQLIFAPYAQTRGVLIGSRSGLGLGLSVVRRILELHRGSIRVSSAGPMKGSEFIASIPVLEAEERHESKPASPKKAPAPVRVRKILVVDDNESIRKSLTRLFKAWGHEVAVAEDGPNALMSMQNFEPDYAVIDITLPGMGGIELAQRLREKFSPAQLFLIALTGRGGADMRASCMAAGFDAFLVKPGEITEFQELLGRGHEVQEKEF